MESTDSPIHSLMARIVDERTIGLGQDEDALFGVKEIQRDIHRSLSVGH